MVNVGGMVIRKAAGGRRKAPTGAAADGFRDAKQGTGTAPAKLKPVTEVQPEQAEKKKETTLPEPAKIETPQQKPESLAIKNGLTANIPIVPMADPQIRAMRVTLATHPGTGITFRLERMVSNLVKKGGKLTGE